jgi:ribosomal protein L37E
MDVKTYDQSVEFADFVYTEIQTLFQEKKLSRLEERIKEIAMHLPKGYSVALNFSVEIIDEEKDKSLKTLNTGIHCSEGEELQFSSSDASPAKYIVDGSMKKVPHDRCPNCWGYWGFKSIARECRQCGYTLGQQVRLLLDSGNCPHCERGLVSYSHPKCEECGFLADPNLVTWG